MTRKQETYVVPAEGYGRDAGKRFVVLQMGAIQQEKWGIRMLNALASSGVEIKESGLKAGFAKFAVQDLSFSSFRGLDWEAMEPLLDEMLACAQLDASGRGDNLRPIKPGTDEVEEVQTLFWLRGKIIELHTGFSFADRLKSLSASKTKKSPRTPSRTSRG